eukprot:4091676-Heterocapsa_arctica.AAC.1
MLAAATSTSCAASSSAPDTCRTSHSGKRTRQVATAAAGADTPPTTWMIDIALHRSKGKLV